MGFVTLSVHVALGLGVTKRKASLIEKDFLFGSYSSYIICENLLLVVVINLLRDHATRCVVLSRIVTVVELATRLHPHVAFLPSLFLDFFLPDSISEMRYRESMTDASGEEEGVLESVITGERIGRDEEEQHRAELERNLEDLSLQLSDPSLAADGEDGDEQKPSESSFSIEFARHNSRRREVTIFHGQNSSLLDNTRLGEDEDADYFPYRSDDDAEVHVVGNTMSTVGHHASTVTLSAGLTGRGGRRAFAAETSLSGAEYDPDRPLDSVLNGVAEELSLLNVDNSLAYAKRTTRHVTFCFFPVLMCTHASYI